MIKPLSLEQLRQSLAVAQPSVGLYNGDAVFTRVSTDSRTLQQGDLYVALSGERFDGHDFIDEVIARGCCGIVVDRAVPSVSVPQLVVTDTLQAYSELARLNRAAFTGPLVSITGSCGKTTVKEMLVSVLAQQGNVHFTEKNFNNQIGVPKTLLALNAEHDFSVLELGASMPGDIAHLAQLVAAKVALVNNVRAAHVQGFGSEAAIAQEKSEVYRGLVAGGYAVINLDEPYAAEWLQRFAQLHCVTFARQNTQADVYASNVRLAASGQATFTLHIAGSRQTVSLAVLGEHNIANALAVAAIAHSLAIPAAVIGRGLAGFTGVAGRLMVVAGRGNYQLIDDTYNANPGSARAAVDVLGQQPGSAVFVLGDMAELGDDALLCHRQLGEYAKAKGVAQLCTVGTLSAAATEAFGSGATHFTDKQALIAHLLDQIQSNDHPLAILVKGSRSAGMEEVVNALKAEG